MTVGNSASQDSQPQDDVPKTYLYLRLSIILAVVLLLSSILIEWLDIRCLQASISAYYYTPVRAVLVGSFVAIGFALIVYKGQDLREDFCLNLAGMFIPIVAIAPTMDVGTCSSFPPEANPLTTDGSVAPWLIANIRNNMYALLLAGIVAIIVALFFAVVPNRDKRGLLNPSQAMFGAAPEEDDTFKRAVRLLGAALLMVIATGILVVAWDNFYRLAHGYAAVAFFVSLFAAAAFQSVYQWRKKPRWARLYAAMAAAMVIVGVIAFILDLGDYEIIGLELLETFIFVAYWLAQTVEKREAS